MTDHSERQGALVGIAAAAIGLCCGVPLLATTGVFAALAGIGIGSWLLIATGLALTVIGALRWRHHRRARCSVPRDVRGGPR